VQANHLEFVNHAVAVGVHLVLETVFQKVRVWMFVCMYACMYVYLLSFRTAHANHKVVKAACTQELKACINALHR